MASLIVGSLSLATYAMLHPDDGFDPAGSGYDEPAFADTAAGDGAALIQHTYGNREWNVPIHLKALSKDALHDLARDVERNAVKGAPVAFLDDGATDTSYFDLEAARLELNYNNRRLLKNRTAGVLRLWTRPFAHTGTYRVHATGAASNVFAAVLAMPSAIDGDRPAETLIGVRTGSAPLLGPRDGRLIAVAPLPHPSWAAVIPAASLTRDSSSSPSVGAMAGAHASRYLGGMIGYWTDGAISFGLSPTIYAGHRIRALALSRGAGQLFLRGPDGEVIKRSTASVMNGRDWGVTDLGVFTVPDALSEGRTAGLARYRLDAAFVASNAFGAAADAYPDSLNFSRLSVSALVLLPEDQTAFIADHRLEGVAMDRFRGGGSAPLSIVGRIDSEGYTWGLPPSQRWGTQAMQVALGTNAHETVWPLGGASAAANVRFAQALVNVPSLGDWRTELLIGDVQNQAQPLLTPSQSYGLFLAAPSTSEAFIDPVFAEFRGQGSNGFLQLGVGSFLVASVGIPSLGMNNQAHLLTLQMRRFDRTLLSAWLESVGEPGSLIASIAGTYVTSPIQTTKWIPGFYFHGTQMGSRLSPNAAAVISGFRAAAVPSLAAHTDSEVYWLDSRTGEAWRETTGGTYLGDVAGMIHGAIPRLDAPTAAALAVLAMNFGQGQAPDYFTVDVRVRERWSYLR